METFQWAFLKQITRTFGNVFKDFLISSIKNLKKWALCKLEKLFENFLWRQKFFWRELFWRSRFWWIFWQERFGQDMFTEKNWPGGQNWPKAGILDEKKWKLSNIKWKKWKLRYVMEKNWPEGQSWPVVQSWPDLARRPELAGRPELAERPELARSQNIRWKK